MPTHAPIRIVFHGENAASFSDGMAALLEVASEITILPDVLTTSEQREAFARADVIIGMRYDSSLPHPAELRLFHVPGAGTDAVDMAVLPDACVLCNCFGHEAAIAEYVMAALLARHVPLADADRRLRQGEWAYRAGSETRVHDEIAGKTIGLLGFGHIGQAVAARAKAFAMRVHVANRSAVALSPLIDRAFGLDELAAFWPAAEFFVVALPLTEQTRGLIDAAAFAAMPGNAVLVNVGRGPIVDAQALYDALAGGRIAGAVIDTWYRYPSPGQDEVLPSALPFHELPNVVMTPHMSGWTRGTIRRRQQTIAENIRRLTHGEACLNVVARAPTTP